jgi:Flp pilus assembly protein TadD
LRDQGPDSSAGGAGFIALFASLFFVAHPLQTQAVTYIVQRLSSLATLFYLLAVVLYIRGRLGGVGRGKKEKAGSAVMYGFSLLSAVLAMKTKEIAFTLPLMVMLYEFIFFKASWRKRVVILMPILLTMMIIPLGIMGSDRPLGEILSDVDEEMRMRTDMPRWDYMMTQMRVVTTYIRLIFLPVKQNLDYDYPVYRSFSEPPVFLSFIFLVLIMGFGVYMLRVSSGTGEGKVSQEEGERGGGGGTGGAYCRVVGFGIFWFFIALSVTSSIVPIADVIFEHRVYLPSVGAFLAITTSVYMIKERLKRRGVWIERAVIWACAVLVVVLSGTTYASNYRANYNLGIYYYEKGYINRAIQEYQRSIKLNPGYAPAYNNLGNALLSQGLVTEAIYHYQAALRLYPNSSLIHFNLGKVYHEKGSLKEAIQEYQAALEIDPRNAEAHNNLGDVYFRLGFIHKAIEEVQSALKLKPEYPEARKNLGYLLRVLKYGKKNE